MPGLQRTADFPRADQTLRNARFERRSRILWTTAATTRFTHRFVYQRGDLELDLHWTVAEHPTYRIDGRRLWRDRETVDIGRDRSDGEP